MITVEIRPKKKSAVQAFRVNQSVYLGQGGEIAEVADPTGSIAYLLDLLDGSRTLVDLHVQLQQRYPEVTYDEVAAAVEQFDQAGFLEDGVATPDGLLDDYELARWERNLDFLGAFASLTVSKYALQHKIKAARVALLGIGGLGSHLLYDLAAVGVQDIRAVEFDRLELSNLNRQILYAEADIGRPKAELAAARIRAFSPRLRIEILQQRISSTDDVLRVIHDRDYVLCVADRPEMEIISWVNQACVQRGVPLISGGLDTPRGVYWSMIPGQTGCAECWSQQVQREDPLAAAILAEQRRPDRPQYGGDNSSFVPLVTLIAGFMLSDLIRMATGVAPPVSAGRLIEIPFGSGDLREVVRWDRLADCPVCCIQARERELVGSH